MKDERIRIFLSDSQVLFREGMHFVLEGEEDMEVIGEGRNAQEALAFLRKNSVDICVLSAGDASEVRDIKEEFPLVGLIRIVNPGERPLAMANRVTLPRDAYPEELVEAIRQAARKSHSAADNGQLLGVEETKRALREHFLSRVESL